MTEPVRDPRPAPLPAVLAVLPALALTCALTLPAAGQAAPTTPRPGAEASNPALNYFTDVELVNQYGETMRLYSDLLQGKVVLVNTMFTTCTGICPVMSKTIETIQEHAGDRVGRDVHLLSISVDPTTDTPAKLKRFADQYHARHGWYFLTGTKENVAFALQRLGQFTENPEDHQGIIIMGNESTGLWKKAFGLAGADKLIEVFDSVLTDTGAEGAPETGS